MYSLTIGLIVYSSLYLLIKLVLIGFVALLIKADWRKKRPHNGIVEIQYIAHKWVLLLNNGMKQEYIEAQILIHNMLFQVIQFSHVKQKKLMVLFYDQIPQNKLRLLNLKIGQN
jgi:hypothetical protein